MAYMPAGIGFDADAVNRTRMLFSGIYGPRHRPVGKNASVIAGHPDSSISIGALVAENAAGPHIVAS
jgi:hypothetical protein